MHPTLSRPRITAVHPLWAVEAGRITVEGREFPVDADLLPEVRVGNVAARLVHASPRALSVLVPAEMEGGRASVRVDGVPGETAFIEVGVRLATGLHQVDNPVFDRAGNLYVTYSGTRGQQAPVSIFRVRRDGVREPFVTGITNPTSMAFGPDGRLYVSSRFDGTVSRVDENGQVETVAADLGVSCGLAFAADGTLYVGDRSGTIFRVDARGTVEPFASLPASVAAFHLAMGPDQALYVTAPTLASYDSVYRIDPAGAIETISSSFGRPQGLAFDSLGSLYVVEALAGASGVYRLRADGAAEHVVAGPGLVGLAFDPTGGLVVCSNETVYRLDVNSSAH
jgi:sugar lactone lactonase YvrE